VSRPGRAAETERSPLRGPGGLPVGVRSSARLGVIAALEKRNIGFVLLPLAFRCDSGTSLHVEERGHRRYKDWQPEELCADRRALYFRVAQSAWLWSKQFGVVVLLEWDLEPRPSERIQGEASEAELRKCSKSAGGVLNGWVDQEIHVIGLPLGAVPSDSQPAHENELRSGIEQGADDSFICAKVDEVVTNAVHDA
jgi:hypothetical protein